MLFLALTTLPAATPLAAMVMARLAALPDRTADFTQEKHIASLETPLRSSGRLIFRHPAHLEQVTTAPQPETLVIDNGVLSITSAQGESRTLPLDTHPGLQALATTISATLAGDLDALQYLYSVTAEGSLDAWRIVLTPRASAVSRFISTVTLDGAQSDLRRLTLIQTNGETQTTDIRPAK